MVDHIQKMFDFLKISLRAKGFLTLFASSAVLGVISLFLIAFRLGPISRQAKSWNGCVQTTAAFLGTIPGFASVGQEGYEAMSVSLCNGSTPQKEDPPSKAN